MANLRNIADLPIATSTDDLNLIVNDNGSAKQIAASAVRAQANWDETDETSPAFIMNKPVISGGNAVAYHLTSATLYKDSLYSDAVTWSEFQDAFMSGVVRLYNINVTGAIGTIIAYAPNTSNGNKITLYYNAGGSTSILTANTNYVAE